MSFSFDTSKVFTLLNADKVKVGSKGYYADNIKDLHEVVRSSSKLFYGEVQEIRGSEYSARFWIKNNGPYGLFYLVAEPEDKYQEKYSISKDLLGLWEQTICEIRSEIKSQDTLVLVYAKELCDKLEHSMCALAGGPYNLKYSIGED